MAINPVVQPVCKPYPADLSCICTDTLACNLITLIRKADEQYFAPLEDKKATGDVDAQIIADMNRLMAELTARYLLSGF